MINNKWEKQEKAISPTAQVWYIQTEEKGKLKTSS